MSTLQENIFTCQCWKLDKNLNSTCKVIEDLVSINCGSVCDITVYGVQKWFPHFIYNFGLYTMGMTMEIQEEHVAQSVTSHKVVLQISHSVL